MGYVGILAMVIGVILFLDIVVSIYIELHNKK